MKYGRGAVLDWMHRTVGVNNQPAPDEVQTDCPMCGGNKLYFNVQKCVGVCHSASCEWHEKVLLKDLIGIVGFAPDQGGDWEGPEKREAARPDGLPGWPVLSQQLNELLTTNQGALDYLRSREIDDMVTLNWGLTCDGERIYVPILDVDGVLVNYNSRLLPGYGGDDGRKYLYYPGAKTGHFILGWAECRDWEDLALVENTFVSLAYRNRMHCTTTFGSNVSDVQADAIAESGVRRIALLWDENAEGGADRALRKFDDRGVRAAYWKILGQPDDYPIDWVAEKCDQVKACADEGDYFIDLRDECVDYRR